MTFCFGESRELSVYILQTVAYVALLWYENLTAVNIAPRKWRRGLHYVQAQEGGGKGRHWLPVYQLCKTSDSVWGIQ